MSCQRKHLWEDDGKDSHLPPQRSYSMLALMALVVMSLIGWTSVSGCSGAPESSNYDVTTDPTNTSTAVESPPPVPTEESTPAKPHDFVEYKPDEIGFMSVVGLTKEQIERVRRARTHNDNCHKLLVGMRTQAACKAENYATAARLLQSSPKLSDDDFADYLLALQLAEICDRNLATHEFDRMELEECIGDFLLDYEDMIPFVQNPRPSSADWPEKFNFCFGPPTPTEVVPAGTPEADSPTQ